MSYTHLRTTSLSREERLKKFWSNRGVSKEFYLLPDEAWEGRDPADYHDYLMRFDYELKLCHSLGIDAENFRPKCMMDELDEREVTSDATE